MTKSSDKAEIDPIEAAKKEQARIVAETEEMCALPCTPTQDELNQAMADLGKTSHVTVDDEEPASKPKTLEPNKTGGYQTRSTAAE
ncbi:hypothetical protein KFK14_11370 [Sphingobium phenoxybenzoativorans]|uniref:Uncharacterized protein n=1 Tax=Sphingobium phenoxybenzoativorans TaxID=1592790 RepID=A0A975Q3I1_9SPHN|nr:hypothetical protein [Sphingobium phenoxybenzoativorans]QUT07929.1 hypothetical protein KFK14_11370 [Sphingobium phenoxybenzoativorans]